MVAFSFEVRLVVCSSCPRLDGSSRTFPSVLSAGYLGAIETNNVTVQFWPRKLYIYIHRYKYINEMFLIINPITPYNYKVIYIYLYRPSYKC